MPTVKRIVCLANSRKLSGRCVAGKEVSGSCRGAWIRPVSAREHGELSILERRYDDGSDPQLLEIMEVPLLKAEPKGYQQENWILDSSRPCRKVGNARWKDLQQLLDPVGSLWINNRSTARGLNDEVPLQAAAKLSSSLRLVRVSKMTLSVFTYYNKKRVQGRFQHDQTEYRLWVTDPRYEEPYKAKGEGDYTIGESYLTISLSEPFMEKNACYKLIAAIIERGGGTGK